MTNENKRGRPRAYDAEQALAAARDTFWNAGLTGTSLDQLAQAMGMNRPSMYAAFGDKEALYLTVARRYAEAAKASIEQCLHGVSLRESLARAFASMIAFYLSGGARGCFMVGTALVAAHTNEGARAAMHTIVEDLDRLFEQRLRRAVKEGELPPGRDLRGLAAVATALSHSLAVRARAGASRRSLERLAHTGVGLLCAETLVAVAKPPSSADKK